MLVSLLAALVAALCYGLGAVMQAIAVRASSRRPALADAGMPGRVDPGLVIRMLRQWPFIISIVVDLFGFVCQLIALRRLPLFEVQVIIAANLAVTAVCACWLMHVVLTWREWTAITAVVIGVGLLGSSSGAQGATTVGVDFHLALMAALAATAGAGIAAARLPSKIRTPVLGAIAGCGYGVLAVCARILPGFTPQALVRSPAAYTLAAAGIISFMFYASALESGSVTVATAAVILVETIPPAIVGVLLLGDKTKPGMTGLAIAGFAVALTAAVALARFGEAGAPEPGKEGASPMRPAGPSPVPAHQTSAPGQPVSTIEPAGTVQSSDLAAPGWSAGGAQSSVRVQPFWPDQSAQAAPAEQTGGGARDGQHAESAHAGGPAMRPAGNQPPTGQNTG